MTDRVEFLRPRELPGIEALHAERCGRLWRVYHDTYTVCTNFRVEGFAEWRYRRKLYRSSGGGQMFMQPGELHANTQVRGPGNFRVLLISPALVERTALELGLRARVNLRTAYTEDDPQLFDAFAQLHASLERPALALERQSRLAQCLRLFIERCTESPPADHDTSTDRAAVQRIRQIIHERHAEEIALDDLAVAAGVSRFQVVRAFTREVGLPPHAYQIKVRIARAKALLSVGRPAAQVAVDLGFSDQSHFIRHFRRVLGVTPGAYVRARS